MRWWLAVCMLPACSQVSGRETGLARLVLLRSVPGELVNELATHQWTRAKHRLVVYVNAKQYRDADYIEELIQAN